jgi:hypothetical protein
VLRARACTLLYVRSSSTGKPEQVVTGQELFQAVYERTSQNHSSVTGLRIHPTNHSSHMDGCGHSDACQAWVISTDIAVTNANRYLFSCEQLYLLFQWLENKAIGRGTRRKNNSMPKQSEGKSKKSPKDKNKERDKKKKDEFGGCGFLSPVLDESFGFMSFGHSVFLPIVCSNVAFCFVSITCFISITVVIFCIMVTVLIVVYYTLYRIITVEVYISIKFATEGYFIGEI